jgi:hypothetical protein
MSETPSSWALAPFVPGRWFEVQTEVERDFFARVTQANELHDELGPLEQSRFEKSRFLELSFYKECLLCEVQVQLTPRIKGLACLLYGPFGLIIIGGKSQVIHVVNKHSLRHLDAEKSGPEYLRLFCSVIRAELGRFQIVEPDAKLPYKADSSETDRGRFRQMLEPVKMNMKSDESLTATATSIYGGGIYRCGFEIQQNGEVIMLSEEQLCAEIPVCPESFQGPFRIWNETESCC